MAVYFVRMGDFVKIGYSATPKDRIASLQTGCPQPLEVLGIWNAGTKTDEKAYHERFAAHRTHGEWFHAVPDILAEASALNEPAPLSVDDDDDSTWINAHSEQGMLWLVSWGDGDVMIVAAYDEVDLFDILDEIGDPWSATWQPYGSGPLCFRLTTTDEDEIVPDGEGGAWAAPSVRDVNCDTSQAMLETMVGVRGKELARRCTRRLAAEWRNRILESTKRVG
jgi:hypothetical protein